MLHFGSSAVTAETMKTIRISALTRSAISRLYVEPVANQPDVFDVFFLNLYLPRLQAAGGYCFWAREMWVCPSMGPSARRVRLRPKCFLTFPLSPAACRMLKVQGGGVKDAKMPKSFFGFISVACDPICRQTTIFQFFMSLYLRGMWSNLWTTIFQFQVCCCASHCRFSCLVWNNSDSNKGVGYANLAAAKTHHKVTQNVCSILHPVNN